MNRPKSLVKIDRRKFMAGSVAAVAAPMVISSRAFGANDRLNIGGIGIGGKGRSDIARTSAGQNVVAICDVDESRGQALCAQIGQLSGRRPVGPSHPERGWLRQLTESYKKRTGGGVGGQRM